VTTQDAAALSVRNLGKRFGDRVAFEDVSFEIGPGEVFGFLGPNGGNPVTGLRRSSLAHQADFRIPGRGRPPGCAHRPSISDWQVFWRLGKQPATVRQRTACVS
jgi:hypothetical protein